MDKDMSDAWAVDLLQQYRDCRETKQVDKPQKERKGYEILTRATLDQVERHVTEIADKQDQSAFIDLVRAAFWALRAPTGTRKGEAWRKRTFTTIVAIIHAKDLPKDLVASLVETLLQQVHLLRPSDLPIVVDTILQKLAESQHSTSNEFVWHTIELLPQLLLRLAQVPTVALDTSETVEKEASGVQLKDDALNKLFAQRWPKRFFLQALKTFRNFSLDTEQELALCSKIVRDCTEEFREVGEGYVTYELLPTIFYNVMLLVGKLSNVFCKRLMLAMILHLCDQLSNAIGAARGRSEDDRTSSLRELRSIQSTMLYEFSLLLQQEDGIAPVLLAVLNLETGNLTSFNLSLLLIVASRPKHQSTVLSNLQTHIIQSYREKAPSDSHVDDQSFRDALLESVTLLQDGSLNPITHTLLSFGFRLMEQSTKERRTKGLCLWQDYGLRLILRCFHLQEAAREEIVQRIMSAVISRSSSLHVYLLLLTRVVDRHRSEMKGGLLTKIQDCLEYMTYLPPSDASALFSALGPLLQDEPSLKNLFVLTLRKAMFRKDEGSRIVGIQGLSFLLGLSSQVFRRHATLTQLYSQNVGTLLSQQPTDDASVGSQRPVAGSQVQTDTVVAEELFRQFCGVFKKALQLQPNVRLTLYAELLRVFQKCPMLRPAVLDLVFRHLQTYIDTNASVLPPIKVDACLPKRVGAYEEPLGYLLHLLAIGVLDLRKQYDESADVEDMLDAQVSTQASSATLSFEKIDRTMQSVMERMRKCTIDNFDLDKSSSFVLQESMGESNLQVALTLQSIWEVCMNWSIATSSTWPLDTSTWDDCIHFLQMHRWVSTKVEEASLKDVATSKKSPKKQKRVVGKSKIDDTFFRRAAPTDVALLVSPSNIATALQAALKRYEREEHVPSKDSDDLVLFLLAKAKETLELVVQSVVSAPRKRRKRPMSDGNAVALTTQFAPLLLSLFFSFFSSTNADAKRRERHALVRCACLEAFYLVLDVWTSLSSIDDTADWMMEALTSCRLADEKAFGYLRGAESLHKSTQMLQMLLDELVQKHLFQEAAVVFDMISTMYAHLPLSLVEKELEWMKRTLTTANVYLERLVTNMTLVFLQPHPQSKFQSTLAVQITKGLLDFCNGAESTAAEMDGPEPLDLEMLESKAIVTIAFAVVSKSEEEALDLEAAVKRFDSSQRRLELRLGDSDVSTLHALEEENRFPIRDVIGTSEGMDQFQFKALCKRIYDVAGILQPFITMDHNTSALSLRVVRLLLRVYKQMGVLVKVRVRRKQSSLPKFLQRLFDRLARDMSPTLLQFIACIHKEEKDNMMMRGSKGKGKGKKTGATGWSKLIPEVVFRMEQLDVALLQLSKVCTDYDFDSWCKLRQSRDFRFNKNLVRERMQDEGEADTSDSTNKKRPRSEEEEEEEEATQMTMQQDSDGTE